MPVEIAAVQGFLMDEEKLRDVAGKVMAYGFLLEILMARYLKAFPPEGRAEIIGSILGTGMRTDHFAGLIKNDETTAELFADVVVKSHQELERLVLRALDRTKVGETRT